MSAFSMPSPSAKRTKPVTLIGPPTLPSASFSACADALLVVVDERLLEQGLLLVEGLQPRLGDLLDHRLGLALLAELVGQNVLLALDDRRIDAGRIDRERIGRRDMHRDLPAERRKLVRLAGRFQRDQHADLAEPFGDRVVHVAADHALPDRQHGRAAQRHVLADGGDRRRDRVRDRHRAGLGGLDRLDVAADR